LAFKRFCIVELIIFALVDEIVFDIKVGIVAVVIKALVEVNPVLIFIVVVEIFVSTKLGIVAFVIIAFEDVNVVVFILDET